MRNCQQAELSLYGESMTNFLVWQERWNTDIPDVDEQHLALANQMNRIAELLNQSGRREQQEADRDSLLNGLYRLSCEHFNSEEARMRQVNYPDYIAHHKEHVMLLAELARYIREIRQGQSALDIGTLRALRTWFVVHLAEADAAFASYYHRKMCN
jgi:hemerythrin